MSEELREALWHGVATTLEQLTEPTANRRRVLMTDLGIVASAVLALPELAALIADAKRVRRVRAEVDAWGEASREWYYEHRHDSGGTTYACGFEDGWNHAEECIGRALSGEPQP